MRSPLLTIAFTLTTLAITATAALAESATATTNANVRNSPGGFILDQLTPGEEVDVQDCDGSWCFVVRPGPNGWVKKSLLAFFYGSIYEDGDDVSPDPVLPTPGHTQVCFYSQSNFNGSSFCAVPGDYDDNMAGSWNDTIGSLTIEGGASVYVCDDAFYGPGNCASYSSDKSSLGGLNNAISSYQVN